MANSLICFAEKKKKKKKKKKNVSSFCIKLPTFLQKNINWFENTLATTIKTFVIHELDKLTMLCTSGPWMKGDVCNIKDINELYKS